MHLTYIWHACLQSTQFSLLPCFFLWTWMCEKMVLFCVGQCRIYTVCLKKPASPFPCPYLRKNIYNFPEFNRSNSRMHWKFKKKKIFAVSPANLTPVVRFEAGSCKIANKIPAVYLVGDCLVVWISFSCSGAFKGETVSSGLPLCCVKGEKTS